MKLQKIVIAALAALLFTAAPALGSVAEVGASGQCYNEDASDGGQAETRVSDEEVTLLDPQGTVDALSMFARGSAEDRNTGSACDRYDCYNETECDERPQRSDYLEVHVTVGDDEIQVCYDGTASTAGGCPHTPGGPGVDHDEM